jgi:glycosyltransferase involved in cell wall biosynthesis
MRQARRSSEATGSTLNRWLVVGVPPQRRYGWEIRASRIFEGLLRRRPSFVMHRPTFLAALRLAATHRSNGLAGTAVAATDLLPSAAVLAIARRIMSLEVLDVHDHPVLQRDALGLGLLSRERDRLNTLFDANIASFSRLVVPSTTFAELADVPVDQRIVIPNGTDTGTIRPGRWPSSPVTAMVSGAAPGRGIELLIDAMGLVRLQHPDATLRLALIATDDASGAYMEDVRRRAHDIAWLSVQTIPHTGIGAFLAQAMVIAVPHPPGAYMDASLPIKLFDAMAAARPVLVTPRIETARVVREPAAGVVATSDTPEDVAHTLTLLLGDEALVSRSTRGL